MPIPTVSGSYTLEKILDDLQRDSWSVPVGTRGDLTHPPDCDKEETCEGGDGGAGGGGEGEGRTGGQKGRDGDEGHLEKKMGARVEPVADRRLPR